MDTNPCYLLLDPVKLMVSLEIVCNRHQHHQNIYIYTHLFLYYIIIYLYIYIWYIYSCTGNERFVSIRCISLLCCLEVHQVMKICSRLRFTVRLQKPNRDEGMNYSDEQGTLTLGHLDELGCVHFRSAGLQPRSYPSCKPKCTSPTRHD